MNGGKSENCAHACLSYHMVVGVGRVERGGKPQWVTTDILTIAFVHSIIRCGWTYDGVSCQYLTVTPRTQIDFTRATTVRFT